MPLTSRTALCYIIIHYHAAAVGYMGALQCALAGKWMQLVTCWLHTRARECRVCARERVATFFYLERMKFIALMIYIYGAERGSCRWAAATFLPHTFIARSASFAMTAHKNCRGYQSSFYCRTCAVINKCCRSDSALKLICLAEAAIGWMLSSAKFDRRQTI
jgi:hypothetical protein